MDVGTIAPFNPQNFDRPGVGTGSSSSSIGSADQKFSKVLENKNDKISSDPSQNAVQNKIGVNEKTNKGGETVDSIPRRAALQSFLRKMREQLGVDASEVVDVLSSLSQEELGQHPLANLDKILDRLELFGDQREKAQLLFLDFLKQTSSNSFADHLKTSNRELSMEVLSQRELRDRKLQDSLAQLNQNFFTQAQPKSDEQDGAKGAALEEDKNRSLLGLEALGLLFGAGAAVAVQGASSSAEASSSTANSSEMALPNAMSADASQGMTLPEGFEAVKPQTVAAPVQAQGQPVLTQMPQVNQAQPAVPSLEEQLQGFKLDPSLSKSVASKQGQTAYELPKVKAAMAAPAATEMAALGASGANGSASSLLPSAVTGASSTMFSFGDDQDSSGGEASADSLMQDPFANPAMGAKATKTDSLTQQFTISMPQATPQQEAVNIDKVIRQAEMLSVKGGGEMKIAMTPEGMGEVAMKVSVKDGTVNVEMVADSSEAKSLLERGIGELKSSLASHKLNVDQIKVDFQGDISKQFDDQRQNAERQMAQQFLEDFRQQNNGWRRGFYDIPGMDPTRRLDSDPAEKRITGQSRTPKASSRRLDLVA